MTEVRTHPVIGTRYVEHALYRNGLCIHRQLSPYSDQEIRERVRAFIHPTVAPDIKAFNYRSKPGKTAPKYEWRTGPEE